VEKRKKVKKEKNVKKFHPPLQGFEPQILEKNFPAQDLNFEGRLDQSSSHFFKNLNFMHVEGIICYPIYWNGLTTAYGRPMKPETHLH